MEKIGKSDRPIVIISDDAALTYGVLLDFSERGLRPQIYELKSSHFPQELETISTEHIPADSECIDFLFFVHDRHDGNKEAARRYLEWETGLIAQLDEDEINLYDIH
jgi:hypothetical protein